MANNELAHGLSNLEAVPGSRKERIRVGRGIGSGKGKTSGRGGKGQTARSGKGRPFGFEGGQIPLYRRLPKFGFKNPTRKEYATVNLSDLDAAYKDGESVTPENLVEKKCLRSKSPLVKVLGDGALTKKLSIKAHKFSKSAIQKINQAGGTVEEIKIERS